MTTRKSTRSIFILGISLMVLFGYNFLSAWDNALDNPPNSNVPAPINIGSDAQDKAGALGVSWLNAFSGMQVYNASPALSLNDTDERNWWLQVNQGRMFMVSSDNYDNWGAYPYPLELYSDGSSASGFARFQNQVRAEYYCDSNGGNCTTAAQFADTGAYSTHRGCMFECNGTPVLCPAGTSLIGFNADNVGKSYSTTGTIYCR